MDLANLVSAERKHLQRCDTTDKTGQAPDSVIVYDQSLSKRSIPGTTSFLSIARSKLPLEDHHDHAIHAKFKID